MHMTTKVSVETLLDQILGLPHEPQAKLIETLIEMRVADIGLYDPDDDAPASEPAVQQPV
jgi:hypothetical protein